MNTILAIITFDVVTTANFKNLILIFFFSLEYRFTWVYRSDSKHSLSKEANSIPDWVGVPWPIQDCKSMWWVPQTYKPVTRILHRETWLPQRHCSSSVWCGQEVDEGKENPYGSLEKEKLHANEMVRFKWEVVLSWWWIHKQTFNLVV